MKRKEARSLASVAVDIIMDEIKRVLDNGYNAYMEITSEKIEGQNMLALYINIAHDNSSKLLNLYITNEHDIVIYEEFLNRVINDILPNETIGATKFYSFRGRDMINGINIINSNNIKIVFNMYGIDKEIVDNYNRRYNKFVDRLEDHRPKTRKN